MQTNHTALNGFIRIFIRTVYRLRVVGGKHLPIRGGALLVANHLSFIDALLLLASSERSILFLMERDFYEKAFIRPFAGLLGVIPISSRSGPRELIRSLREASRAVQQGQLVCIFAEGQITRTGQLLTFRRGFERIMKNSAAPIIPTNLDRVWGSIFSFHDRRFFWKIPRRIPYPVTVSYGQPMPANAKAEVVRQAVQELSTEAQGFRKLEQIQLQRVFVQRARRHPWRLAVADGHTHRVGYLGLLIRSVFLAHLWRRRWKEQRMVGLLLPASVIGAACNLAALLAGKVPVNLNYTLSRTALDSCISQCGIETLIVSRQLLQKLQLPTPPDAIVVEDLVGLRSPARMLVAILQSLFLPKAWLERVLGNSSRGSVNELATVIFSSGSTGEPKGVMLSHSNVYSNLQAMLQVFGMEKRDRVLGVLPFFHSFGFTATLCLPLGTGIGAVFHPNPLEARVIGELCARHRATILLATPSFLQGYLRRCEAEDFGSLRLVMVGAEKLTESLALAFEEKFGLRPLEGYGCTECAPIVAVNVANHRAAGIYQAGQKRESIGRPLPGISVRIVHPETFEPLAHGQSGLLLVKGPNVMLGYLNQPELTAEVIREGWYITGDLAELDEDGFLTIKDRLSRFSKVSGEMVPHLKVEETLHQLLGESDRVLAVTGVPDERKGERLVVLHTLEPERIRLLQRRLSSAGLPNLWMPRPNAYFPVNRIPVLGSGKLDLQAIRQHALKLSSSELQPSH